MSELITDPENLFRYSGMLDQLRDSAKFLVRHGAHDPSVVATLTRQLATLREGLMASMRADVAEEGSRLVPDLLPGSTLDQVFVAAAALARWVDMVHQTPQYLLSQKVASANALEVTSKVNEVMARKSPAGSLVEGVPSAGMGPYI